MWKKIKGFDYKVSDDGEIMNSRGKILKQSNHRQGYKQIQLRKEGKSYTLYVHRLVAFAFLTGEGNHVNHKDENKSNNHVENLEFCTNQYNHVYSKGISVVQLTMDGEVVKIFKSTQSVREDGFTQSAVVSCCKNKKYFKSHKGFKWKYLDKGDD